jgi:hypothetical protein
MMSVPEQVWQRIDHDLAGERLAKINGRWTWEPVPGVKPLLNMTGRSHFKGLFDAVVANSIAPFGSLQEKDVPKAAAALSLTVIFDLWSNWDDYEIHIQSFDLIVDIITEPMFQIMRSSQGGGLRRVLGESTQIIQRSGPAPEQRPQGGWKRMFGMG